MGMFHVVFYDINEPETKLVIAECTTKDECRLAMRDFANPRGWQMDRRPDMHTYGNFILTLKPKVVEHPY